MDMDMENVVSAGLGLLMIYLLLRPKAKPEYFGPYEPTEEVTSTITYGNPLPTELVS